MQNTYQRYPLNGIHIGVKKEKIKSSTWLLALYLFLAPLDFLPVIPGVSLSRILIFLPLVGCLFYMKDTKIHLDRFFVVPILYVMMVTVTMFYSYDVLVTKQRTISIGFNIAAILVLSMFSYNKRELGKIKKAMVYSGWFILLLMTFYSNISLMDARLIVVVNGAFQDPNYLCGFLIFTIIYYFEEFMQKRKKSAFVIMCVFIVFVLLTGSRGGLVATLGSILFYAVIWIKHKRFNFSSIIKLLSLIFLLSIFFNIALDILPASVAQRYDTSFTLTDEGAGRWHIWESILYNYKASTEFNKLFGWGAGTIRYFTYSGDVGHNIWIESLMEIGIIGVVILLIFYLTYFKKACKMHEYIAAASFVGYMIMTMSLSLCSYKPIWNVILLIMLLKNGKHEVGNNASKDHQSRI